MSLLAIDVPGFKNNQRRQLPYAWISRRTHIVSAILCSLPPREWTEMDGDGRYWKKVGSIERNLTTTTVDAMSC